MKIFTTTILELMDLRSFIDSCSEVFQIEHVPNGETV